jgi:hypothetical protein
VAFAESTDRQFRAPRRDFLPATATHFARALTAAVEVQPAAIGPRRRHQTAIDQLREYFAAPANRKWLTKLVSFIKPGAGFAVIEQ